jgi:small-conductance mechanosensitive channel
MIYRRFRLFLIGIIFILPFVASAQNNGKQKNLTADTLNQPITYSIVDINFEIEQTQRTLSKLESSLVTTSFELNIDSLLREKKIFLKKEANDFNNYNPHNLSKFFLENAFRAWNGHQKELLNWKKIVNEKLSSTQEGINALKKEREIWHRSLENIKKTKGVPIQLLNRVSKLIVKIDNIQSEFITQKKKFIIWEDKVTDLILFSNDVIEEITALQDYLRDNLFVADKEPLWKVKLYKEDIFPIDEKVLKALHDNSKTVINFLSQQTFVGLAIVLILIVVGFFFLRKSYNKLGYDKEKPGFVNANKIFNIHWFASSFFLVLIASLLFLSIIPLSLSAILTMLMLWSVFYILPEFMGKQGKIRIFMIFAIFFINELEVFMWYFRSLARVYILIESMLGIFLVYYYGTNRFNKQIEKVSPFVHNVFRLSIVLMAMFIGAFIGNLFGYVNLSVFLLKIAAKSATIILIIYSVHKILEIIINAGCEVGRASKTSFLKDYWDFIQKRLIQTLNFFAVFFTVKLILESMEMYRTIYSSITDVLVYNIKIGTITLSLGGVIGMILIFIVSFFIANIIRVVFETHEYITNKLSKGLSFAISSTIRYLIIIFGVVLGLAYAGVDMSKFGLLAGALGVGIGFGLQNIVNNFISGLILLYERPVEVGDIIEVGQLMGEVKSIGVRASRVKTYDGAEVVVPNGNIISNDLINWTLSDNKQRVDIRIGVAYGSDPNEVLKLLQQTAVEHNKVLVDPPPRPLFIEFGDSSLNFRLLCWTHFEEGLGVKSDIFTAIYNALADAGIEIPFPQVDLHIKDGLTDSPEVIIPKAPDNSPEVIKQANEEETDKKTNKQTVLKPEKGTSGPDEKEGEDLPENDINSEKE